MCENSAPHKHDLGRQEPRGCRFIYGDPAMTWHFCQRTIAAGGKPGDSQNPPYCVHHVKVCVPPLTPSMRRARIAYLEHMAKSEDIKLDPSAAGWGAFGTVPADVFVKFNRTQGEFSHD